MPATEPRLTLDQRAELGREVYQRHVRPKLTAADDGKFVAVDVVTGEYEIDDDDHEAVSRLHARRPGAEVWLEMAGEPTAYKLRAGR